MAETKCEYEDCSLVAIGYVEAQWSIFDFLRYEMCFDHLYEAQDRLSEQEVEDFGTPYTAVHLYDMETWTDLHWQQLNGTIDASDKPQDTTD